MRWVQVWWPHRSLGGWGIEEACGEEGVRVNLQFLV